MSIFIVCSAVEWKKAKPAKLLLMMSVFQSSHQLCISFTRESLSLERRWKDKSIHSIIFMNSSDFQIDTCFLKWKCIERRGKLNILFLSICNWCVPILWFRLSKILTIENYDEIFANADRYNAENLITYCLWFKNWIE